MAQITFFAMLLDQLREAVRKDGRSHAQIATEAGIHPTTFYAFMHGRRGLSIRTIENLAKSLNFEIKLGPLRRGERQS